MVLENGKAAYSFWILGERNNIKLCVLDIIMYLCGGPVRFLTRTRLLNKYNLKYSIESLSAVVEGEFKAIM